MKTDSHLLKGRLSVLLVSNQFKLIIFYNKDSLSEWVHPNGDLNKIAKMALTKMVMEKAIDYPDSEPEFL